MMELIPLIPNNTPAPKLTLSSRYRNFRVGLPQYPKSMSDYTPDGFLDRLIEEVKQQSQLSILMIGDVQLEHYIEASDKYSFKDIAECAYKVKDYQLLSIYLRKDFVKTKLDYETYQSLAKSCNFGLKQHYSLNQDQLDEYLVPRGFYRNDNVYLKSDPERKQLYLVWDVVAKDGVAVSVQVIEIRSGLPSWVDERGESKWVKPSEIQPL